MSRTSFVMLAVAFGLVASAEECRAQVGFGARQTWVNSGGSFQVAPIVTNGGRYARMGMSVGFSQVVDVHTFSPVRGYSGLMPVNPIGFAPIPGLPGSVLNPGIRRWPQGNRFSTATAPPKPTVTRFVVASRKFDQDKDGLLNRAELEKVAIAVVAELKRTPGVDFDKLARAGQTEKKPEEPITDKEVTDAFVKQSLKYDRDQDGALNKAETRLMAAALLRSLG